LENISVFEQSALMLFSSLNQATSILLEESVDSSTSVTSTSSGAQRTKKCPYCSFIMPISETICPNCNKGI